MNVALFEPDIPQNVASFIRLCACMDVQLHIIEPCGFVWDERRMRRVMMDYLDQARILRHASFAQFNDWRVKKGARLVLLSTKAQLTYVNCSFTPDDILLLGRESSGVTPEVVDACEASVTIPMNPNTRSLNVALAASMVLGEALRQTNQLGKQS